jgi:hypothetical protein
MDRWIVRESMCQPRVYRVCVYVCMIAGTYLSIC